MGGQDLPLLAPFIGGRLIESETAGQPLHSPIDLRPRAALVESSEQVITAAVSNSHAAFIANRRASVATRVQWLNAAAAKLDAAVPGLIEMLVTDIGKPRRAATFEAQRSGAFLRACAAQLSTLGGETIPIDSAANGAGRIGFTRRVPYGVVAGITAFNAPINFFVQKVGPAMAMGNAIVVKPHPAGTRLALRVAALIAEAGVPAGLVNVVTGEREAARLLAAHPNVAAVTFTGGTAAGEALARAAGAKKFVAEFGSNAANVVLADADVEDAAKRIAGAAFEASGQQCISAQRIIVEAPVAEAFVQAFVAAARALQVGDPSDPHTDLGPMVSMVAADRVMQMIEDATARGARVALAPTRRNCFVSPGIVVGGTRDARIWCEEAFGPIAVVEQAADIDQALEMANDSPFGLQGAVFTRSLKSAMRFSEEFDVGSLWVNEASRLRLDMYPFGGVKRSGYGREGVRYAMEELSQIKFTGLRFDV